MLSSGGPGPAHHAWFDGLIVVVVVVVDEVDRILWTVVWQLISVSV